MVPSKNPTDASRPRNVLVVCLDTVRADFFAEYAKRLQRLADVSFTQCRAASSWTVPSHASLFTGKLPSEHGVHTHNRRFDSIDREETFLTDLDGYTTFGVSANAFVSPTYGFDSWLDELSTIEPKHRYPEATSLNEVGQRTDATGGTKYIEYLKRAVKHDHPVLSLKNTAFGFLHETTKTGPIRKQVDDGASAVVRSAEQHIEDASVPFFGFCNLMDAHTPLHPCQWFDSSLQQVPNSWSSSQYDVWELMDESERHDEYWHLREQVYGATIEYMDRVLTDFAHRVLDSAPNTTIVVTADHGENHGREADDFLANHKSSLSEGLLHVPLLLINPPDGYESVEDEYVSHLDLGDLVLGLANGETPDVFRDRLPAELVGMSAGPEPPSNQEYWDRMIRCVYDGATKTVWDSLENRTEYELDRDRLSWQEKVETDEGTPTGESEFFDTTIGEAKTAAKDEKTDEAAVDSATESRLKELGYL
ncbi:sulfatase-like hydrolase/transferase [Haladaptatus caseinilyticus]|uniref:sulfatase-like hydrolase/transferase n=1 Tax=Haladaptatus caseinilyticus TaxID=2993314 RepID=UPI00224AF7DA|nr:sulfatase-like hydrolase/transferase [Haladaptatus caseinilyticus]